MEVRAAVRAAAVPAGGHGGKPAALLRGHARWNCNCNCYCGCWCYKHYSKHYSKYYRYTYTYTYTDTQHDLFQPAVVGTCNSFDEPLWNVLWGEGRCQLTRGQDPRVPLCLKARVHTLYEGERFKHLGRTVEEEEEQEQEDAGSSS